MVVPAYAVPFVFIFIALSVRTLLLRRSKKIAIGTADSMELARAARAHANFAEYVPLTLLVAYFLETIAPGVWLHGICGCLLLGRIVHAYGISQVEERFVFRVAGMAMTFTALGSAALGIGIALVVG